MVIVGAWLAVLVPMGLRGYENATAARGVERFSDAMRVLSRRPTGNERTTVRPARPHARLALSAERTPAAERRAPIPSFLDRLDDDGLEPPEKAPLSLAARRRRVVLVLFFLAFISGTSSLLGVAVLRWVSALLVLLVVAFLVHCRRQVLLSAARNTARRAPVAARGCDAPRGARVAGIPDRMPTRPAPLAAPLPAPAARHDEPLAASWDPVPVPVPTYVGKATAPRPARRVLDLTQPGGWSADEQAEGEGAFSGDEDLDVILQRRRAVNGW